MEERKTLYRGTILFRDSDPDLSIGDIGYVSIGERPIVQARIAFFLEDVITWEEYRDKLHQLTDDPNKLIRLYLRGTGMNYLCIGYTVFTQIMEDFITKKNGCNKESIEA